MLASAQTKLPVCDGRTIDWRELYLEMLPPMSGLIGWGKVRASWRSKQRYGAI